MAQCEDCATTEMFSTQLQRERWVLKGHIGPPSGLGVLLPENVSPASVKSRRYIMGWHYPEYDPRVDGIDMRTTAPTPLSSQRRSLSASASATTRVATARRTPTRTAPTPTWSPWRNPTTLSGSCTPTTSSSPSAEPWDTPIYHLRTPGPTTRRDRPG